MDTQSYLTSNFEQQRTNKNNRRSPRRCPPSCLQQTARPSNSSRPAQILWHRGQSYLFPKPLTYLLSNSLTLTNGETRISEPDPTPQTVLYTNTHSPSHRGGFGREHDRGNNRGRDHDRGYYQQTYGSQFYQQSNPALSFHIGTSYTCTYTHTYIH